MNVAAVDEVSALVMAYRERERESESERIAEAVNGRFCLLFRAWLAGWLASLRRKESMVYE
jgi:hypothetical protein